MSATSRAGFVLSTFTALIVLATPANAQTILYYDFNETGTTAASQGTDTTPLTMRAEGTQAASVAYSDRTTWESLVNGGWVTETFTVGVNQQLLINVVNDVGGIINVQYTTTDGATNETSDFISAADGSLHLAWDNSAAIPDGETLTLTLTFDNPITAFGADVKTLDLGDLTNLKVQVDGTGPLFQLPIGPANSVEFFGLISNTPFTSISFIDDSIGGSRRFALDNASTVNDAGTATDLHSADARGVSGLAGDRSYQNTAVSDHGSAASSATNGYRADQPDNNAIDGLTSFTISGWIKTDNWNTLSGKTPRIAENHDGTNGFNLQFYTGSQGDLKLEVDSTAAPEVYSGTSGLYAAKNTWVFFAVRYDGTSASDNVDFYRGFRNAAEAASAGAGSAAVAPVASAGLGCTTCTLDRGAVNADTAPLVIGNRAALSRPYDGFIDNLRIDSGLTDLATLETYRSAVVDPDPITVSWVSTTNVATSVQDQNLNPVTVHELSGLAYDPATDRFFAVADSNGRVLQLDVDFDANGAITAATPVSAVTLPTADDFEGIALGASGASSAYISDEEASPGVREYSLSTGSLIQTLTIPSVFNSSVANRRLESLSRSLDNTEMLTATQQALTVDGTPGTSTTVPSVARMLRFAVTGPNATAAEQHAYAIEPVHAAPSNGDGSSLSDVEFLPDGRLLSIERSDGNAESLVRIFDLQRIGATDVGQGATATGLIGQTYTPVGKTLLFSDTAGFGKLEAFAIGPQLPDGRYAALASEDNSGSGPNVLHSFIVDIGAPPPDPDGDSDGVPDSTDNCPATANADQADTDSDTVGNVCDNCTLRANASQVDSDGDSYGNRCDGDLNNNGSTNAQDTSMFRTFLGAASTPPTYHKADLNANGSVNAQDTSIFRTLLGSPPGPSGLVP